MYVLLDIIIKNYKYLLIYTEYIKVKKRKSRVTILLDIKKRETAIVTLVLDIKIKEILLLLLVLR
jgi:hypothetical protein